MITNERLKQWLQWARRDDAFTLFVPSDIREMIGEIMRLRGLTAMDVGDGYSILLSLAWNLREALPNDTLNLHIEGPLRSDGIWHLDLQLVGRRHVYVEWSEKHGFGLSDDDVEKSFGQGPDEICKTAEEAQSRLIAYLVKGEALGQRPTP